MQRMLIGRIIPTVWMRCYGILGPVAALGRLSNGRIDLTHPGGDVPDGMSGNPLTT